MVQVMNRIGEMRSYCAGVKREGRTLGLVPTMGYLHGGHLELMKTAKKECDVVVASIFVNPTQFGPGEDYQDYPRDLARDAALAEGAGVDAIFAPSAQEMYPQGYHTFVQVESLTDYLCGASRPGHFRGVTTVVSKLFHIVQPDRAYFGQKDAQQVTVIERMVEDLNLPVTIIRVPTVREPDGLALSSRNAYLDPEERRQAPVLFKSLVAAQDLVERGERETRVVKNRIREILSQASLGRIDYVETVNARTMEPLERITGTVLIALAVRFGKTRLIDNILIDNILLEV